MDLLGRLMSGRSDARGAEVALAHVVLALGLKDATRRVVCTALSRREAALRQAGASGTAVVDAQPQGEGEAEVRALLEVLEMCLWHGLRELAMRPKAAKGQRAEGGNPLLEQSSKQALQTVPPHERHPWDFLLALEAMNAEMFGESMRAVRSHAPEGVTARGLSRAWLRHLLNSSKLEETMRALCKAIPVVGPKHYEDWAFLRWSNEVNRSLFFSLAGVLDHVDFDLGFTVESLNRPLAIGPHSRIDERALTASPSIESSLAEAQCFAESSSACLSILVASKSDAQVGGRYVYVEPGSFANKSSGLRLQRYMSEGGASKWCIENPATSECLYFANELTTSSSPPLKDWQCNSNLEDVSPLALLVLKYPKSLATCLDTKASVDHKQLLRDELQVLRVEIKQITALQQALDQINKMNANDIEVEATVNEEEVSEPDDEQIDDTRRAERTTEEKNDPFIERQDDTQDGGKRPDAGNIESADTRSDELLDIEREKQADPTKIALNKSTNSEPTDSVADSNMSTLDAKQINAVKEQDEIDDKPASTEAIKQADPGEDKHQSDDSRKELADISRDDKDVVSAKQEENMCAMEDEEQAITFNKGKPSGHEPASSLNEEGQLSSAASDDLTELEKNNFSNEQTDVTMRFNNVPDESLEVSPECTNRGVDTEIFSRGRDQTPDDGAENPKPDSTVPCDGLKDNCNVKEAQPSNNISQSDVASNSSPNVVCNTDGGLAVPYREEGANVSETTDVHHSSDNTLNEATGPTHDEDKTDLGRCSSSGEDLSPRVESSRAGADGSAEVSMSFITPLEGNKQKASLVSEEHSSSSEEFLETGSSSETSLQQNQLVSDECTSNKELSDSLPPDTKVSKDDSTQPRVSAMGCNVVHRDTESAQGGDEALDGCKDSEVSLETHALSPQAHFGASSLPINDFAEVNSSELLEASDQDNTPAGKPFINSDSTGGKKECETASAPQGEAGADEKKLPKQKPQRKVRLVNFDEAEDLKDLLLEENGTIEDTVAPIAVIRKRLSSSPTRSPKILLHTTQQESESCEDILEREVDGNFQDRDESALEQEETEEERFARYAREEEASLAQYIAEQEEAKKKQAQEIEDGKVDGCGSSSEDSYNYRPPRPQSVLVTEEPPKDIDIEDEVLLMIRKYSSLDAESVEAKELALGIFNRTSHAVGPMRSPRASRQNTTLLASSPVVSHEGHSRTESSDLESISSEDDLIDDMQVETAHVAGQYIKGSGRDAHVCFVIRTQLASEEIESTSGTMTITVQRRFNQFKELLAKLEKSFGSSTVSLPELPKTAWVRNFSESYIVNKRNGLDQFLKQLLTSFSPDGRALASHPLVRSFLTTTDSAARAVSGGESEVEPVQDKVPRVAGGLRVALITEQRPEPKLFETEASHSLEEQDFKCSNCACDISISMGESSTLGFGWQTARGRDSARFCYYTERWFCPPCFLGQDPGASSDEEAPKESVRILPTRVLHHWDFDVYPVACPVADYLDSILDLPILCVSAVNPSLFEQIEDLKAARQMRLQLLLAKEIVGSCPLAKSSIMSKKLLEGETEMYTLNDLYEVFLGTLLPRMERTLERVAAHITVDCESCKSLGVACQICSIPEPVFQFQSNVVACRKCHTPFHRDCFANVGGEGGCPSCLRELR